MSFTYTPETDNDADVLDSRDIENRINELEDRIVECDCSPRPELGIIHFPFCALFDDEVNIDPLDEDEVEELAKLKAFREEAQNCTGEWEWGVSMIREDHFIDYAIQLAEDIGSIDREAAWPACHVDWDAAADSLKIDYSEIDYDGVTYYIR